MNAGTSTMCPECQREMREGEYYANEPQDDLNESPLIACGQGRRPDQLAFSAAVVGIIAALCVIGLIGLTLGIVTANLTAP